jgi:uroporphyrinogen III methyltransferase/synthase
MTHAGPQTGLVYLVGAGPGDPKMITLRAVECLARADVVYYDYLVDPRVLQHCPERAQCVCLGRHGQGRLVPQEEINALLVRDALAGKQVVRLKSGDPAIFAHGAEEAEALAAAGIRFEIVPGVTAALAAAAGAGIPLTHRHRASAVALVTGQQAADNPSGLDFAALAAFPGTLVVYMGVTTARQWTAQLVAAGKPGDTPAAIVRRCTWPDQQVYYTTLAAVADVIEQRRLRPPVMVILGAVVELARHLAPWQRRPLSGCTILVTRPAGQAAALVEPLEELGAHVLVQPAIEILPPEDPRALDDALQRLSEFDWVVFSSANGVEHFFGRLLASGRDLRALGGVRLAAIGPATAACLARYHLQAELQPEEFRAEALAAALRSQARGRRFLLVRASRGRDVLARELSAAGAEVCQVVAYQSRDVAAPQPEIAAALSAGAVHWVTVTSSAIARSLVRLFGPSLRQARLVSISPVTTQTLCELGYPPAAEARHYTMQGVVDALREAVAASRSSTPAS